MSSINQILSISHKKQYRLSKYWVLCSIVKIEFRCTEYWAITSTYETITEYSPILEVPSIEQYQLHTEYYAV